MSAHRKIIKEVVEEGYLRAVLYSTGVIQIFWDSSLETIDVAHLSKMQQVIGELGEGKKMPLLFMPHDFLHLSKEGGKYATSEEGTRFSQAIAVLVDNLAKRILLNFFLSFNKPKILTKGFTNKEDAFEWLERVTKQGKAKPVVSSYL